MINRRRFLLAVTSTLFLQRFAVAANEEFQDTDRSAGLLWGSLIGDAMGGPLEFAKPEKRMGRVVGCRAWPKTKRLDDDTIAEIQEREALASYTEVRPDTAPYGPWVRKAPAGTITDDSRLKIVLIRAIRDASRQDAPKLTQAHIAKEILRFSPLVNKPTDQATRRLLLEGMREYRYAANWVLGKRDPKDALPLDRLWAGVANCSGQMMFLPLAIRFAGRPEDAYRESFELNFVDSSQAKDICSAIIAGLASALGEDADSLTPSERWEKLEQTMRSIDPFRLNSVPFVGRPLDKWLDLVDSIVERADGRPAVAYKLLETEGKPVYFWDAHFTLLVALTLLKLCNCNTLCALHLAIDFGHDTDSYAQLIGALGGAVGGANVFPLAMRQIVANRLRADYGEEVSEWTKVLSANSGTKG